MLLFLDPIAWAIFLILLLFKIITFCISGFIFCNVFVYLKYSVLQVTPPTLEPEDLLNIDEPIETDPELIQQELDGKMYGKKLGSNFNTTCIIIFLDYLMSWCLFSTGDGLLFGWTNHWCVLFSPLLQVMWSYSVGSTVVWLSWSIMVHFVIAVAIHLFLYQFEWSSSSPFDWVLGLLSGMYKLYYRNTTTISSTEVINCATLLNIQDDMVAATTNETVVVKAYKKAALKWHPDRARVWSAKGTTPEEANEKFRECKKARDVLIDEYVKTRQRAISFLTKTCPVVLIVTVLDRYTLGIVWSGDSWWPLAWLFWTLISHGILTILLWFMNSILPYPKSMLPSKYVPKRSGLWFKVAMSLIGFCSIIDGYMATGWLWRRYEKDDATSAWFLYWELIWMAGVVTTHVFAFALMLFFTPGEEWTAVQVLQEKHKQEKATFDTTTNKTNKSKEDNPEEKKDEEQELEDRQLSEILCTFFLHTHTLIKMGILIGISSMDYMCTNFGLFWNKSLYSWPWNFVIGSIFILLSLLRLVFLLLVLFHFAGTTGAKIRKCTAASVLPVLLVFVAASIALGGGVGDEIDGIMQGSAGFNVEEVTQSMFAEADKWLDDDEEEEIKNTKSTSMFQEMEKMRINQEKEQAEQAEQIQQQQEAEEDQDAKFTTVEKEEGNPIGDSVPVELTCTWTSWLLLSIVRILAPAGYVICAVRRKVVKDSDSSSNSDDRSRQIHAPFMVWRNGIVRWTTVTCGLCLWFGTITTCSTSMNLDRHLYFATPLLLLGVRRNGPKLTSPFTLLQSSAVKWLLRILCVIYFPYNDWNDTNMLRMYICLGLPVICLSFGLLFSILVDGKYVDVLFNTDTKYGTFLEMISGDAASKEFQNWFDTVIEVEKENQKEQEYQDLD